MIVFAAIAPHGGPVFDLPESATRTAMEELGRRHAEALPDVTVVATPHGVHVEGHFSVVLSAQLEGDASQWTTAESHPRAPATRCWRDAAWGRCATSDYRRPASRSGRAVTQLPRCRSTGVR